MFGKEVKVKAKPAKTVVKAFPVAALKIKSKGEGSVALHAFSEVLPWESHGAGLSQALLGGLFATVHLPVRGPPVRNKKKKKKKKKKVLCVDTSTDQTLSEFRFKSLQSCLHVG